MSRRSRGGAPAGTRRAAAWRIPDSALALAAGLLALLVYRGAPGAYFSPDDLQMLERARHVLPPEPGLWRWLSGQGYFGAAVALFGTRPWPYHVVSWLLHGANAALLFLWIRRRGMSAPPAFLAAGLFAATRLLLTAVYPATGIGELLALAFTLGAFLVLECDGAWAAVAGSAFFGAALLSKESVALAPAVLLLPGAAPGPLGARARRAAPLLALSALFGLWLFITHVRSGSLGGEAYAMAFGPNLFHNWMTYCSWILDLSRASVGADSMISDTAWTAGLWLVVVVAAAALAAWRRTPWPAIGAALWLLTLAPVLPLTHHTYLHYLYTPLAGLAVGLGGVVEWALGNGSGAGPGGPGGRAREPEEAAGGGLALTWVVVGLIVAGHAAQSIRLLDSRMAARMEGVDLPADSWFRKSEYARNAASTLEPAFRGRRHLRVLIYMPRGPMDVYDAATGELLPGKRGQRRPYRLVDEALDHGRALRALFPQVDSVVTLDRWDPAFSGFELLLYNAEGRFRDLGTGAAAHRQLVMALLDHHYFDAAREHLATVVPLYPDNPSLRFQYGFVLAHFEDRPGAIAQLEELIRRTPDDTLAANARQVVARLRALK